MLRTVDWVAVMETLVDEVGAANVLVEIIRARVKDIKP